MIDRVRFPLRAGIALAVLTTSATLAAAPLDPKAAIVQRRAAFKRMGAAFKLLNDQLKTSAPARDQMALAARVIATTARPQAGLFPPGSGAGAGVPSDALPAVWTNRAAFDAQMARLMVETNKLVAVTAGGDVAAIGAQTKATGAVCSGCHRQFRADD